MDTILMGLYRDNGKGDGNYDNGGIQGSWKKDGYYYNGVYRV